MTFTPALPWAVLVPVVAVLLVVCAVNIRAARSIWIRRLVMVLLMGVVIAQPAFGSTPTRVDRSNLDVLFVIDNSPSVNAQDYGGTQARLVGVRHDGRALTDSLPGARFSVITFGSTASQIVPFTTDSRAVDGTLEVLQPEYYSAAQGSTLSRPLGLLRSVLDADRRAAPTRQRLVVLFSDGEQTNNGTPASFAPARGLVEGGAVFGYGTARGAHMLGYDPNEPTYRTYIHDGRGALATSKANENTLRAAARQLGVPYKHRVAPTSVRTLLALPTTRGSGSGVGGTVGRPGYWVAAAALGLLALWEVRALAADIRPRRGRTR